MTQESVPMGILISERPKNIIKKPAFNKSSGKRVSMMLEVAISHNRGPRSHPHLDGDLPTFEQDGTKIKRFLPHLKLQFCIPDAIKKSRAEKILRSLRCDENLVVRIPV